MIIYEYNLSNIIGAVDGSVNFNTGKLSNNMREDTQFYFSDYF